MKWQKADLDSKTFEILRQSEIDPPIESLYYSGVIPSFAASLGVVGSRRVSEYGKRVCSDFISVLARAGITIVSGLMYGVDLEAHNAAIEAGGKTVGVLGYGSNFLSSYGYAKNLSEKIIDMEMGAVVSEYEPDTPAAKWTFPKRNRVISALSKAVLVIEAGENSGSLITAGYALDQGKDVFAIPGSIYNSNSKGTNWLIKQGAQIATSVDDILMYFNKTSSDISRSASDLEEADKTILDTIESLGELATTVKIQAALKLPIGELISRLSKLEILGYITKDIFGKFSVLR